MEYSLCVSYPYTKVSGVAETSRTNDVYIAAVSTFDDRKEVNKSNYKRISLLISGSR
jgi:hypothetical protein